MFQYHGVLVRCWSRACGERVCRDGARQQMMAAWWLLVDVGSPMWAMHSARESAGADDPAYMIAALGAAYAD